MNIYRKAIERITIIGLREQASEAFAYCEEHGYHIIVSGPKMLRKYQPDPDKYRIVAEREAIK